MIRRPPRSTLFPTRRSSDLVVDRARERERPRRVEVEPMRGYFIWLVHVTFDHVRRVRARRDDPVANESDARSEEHTSELQSPCNLVCRLLLEKKKQNRGQVQ